MRGGGCAGLRGQCSQGPSGELPGRGAWAFKPWALRRLVPFSVLLFLILDGNASDAVYSRMDDATAWHPVFGAGFYAVSGCARRRQRGVYPLRRTLSTPVRVQSPDM